MFGFQMVHKKYFLWHLEAKHPIGIGRNREKVGKSYYENALTLSARFGAKLKNTSVDLTYVKFQVISSSNQLKNRKIHAGRAQTSSLNFWVLGVKKGVYAPPEPTYGGWRVNSS